MNVKKKLNIKFVGFSSAFPVKERPFYRRLSQRYEFCDRDEPDYIIDNNSMFAGFQYADCVKILFQVENCVADFNAYDYVVGFDYMSFGDRYLRNPYFARSRSFGVFDIGSEHSSEELLSRKFCSFVVSNASMCDPIRRKFFERLSKYKKVDSGGRYMNNIGGPVKDKIGFCRGYKFNIAFENSASPGYTTEKIMEAYVAQSVPIYFGNPMVETDFRLESMVRVKDESDIERAVEEVIRLDKDDAAYLAKCHERCFAVSDPTIYEKQLEEFLVHIFEQPLDQARRRNRYGYQAMMQEHLRKVMSVDARLCDLRNKFSRIFRWW